MTDQTGDENADMTIIVYNSDGSAFFNYKRPRVGHSARDSSPPRRRT